MKRKLIALSSVLLLTSSCSTFQVKNSFQVEPLLMPSVKKVCFKNDFKKKKRNLPTFLKKRVFLRMYQPLKVEEVFRLVGVSAVSSTDKKVYIPTFRGTVRELVKIVEDKTGEKAFYTKDGIIFKEKYLASYPIFFPLDDKEKKQIISVVSNLKGKVSFNFNSVTVYGSRKVHKFIKDFLTKRSKITNIKLNLILIEYKKTGEKDIGIKWSGNSLMYSSTGSSGTTLTLKGDSSLSLVFQGSKFSLNAFLGYLEKTGEVRVLKNVLFSVKNGKEATVEDTTLYPYVKQIGVTTVGTQQNTATAQTVDFGESKSGFILKVVPKYYPLSNLLDLKVELNKEKVLSYITVKSGEYEVERPIVDTKVLTSEFLEKPDSVFVMGGIINRESSKELTTPFGIKKLGNRTEKSEYSYLFVVIIPEVIRYETCP